MGDRIVERLYLSQLICQRFSILQKCQHAEFTINGDGLYYSFGTMPDVDHADAGGEIYVLVSIYGGARLASCLCRKDRMDIEYPLRNIISFCLEQILRSPCHVFYPLDSLFETPPI